jgi:hypothetical protein
MKSPTTRSSALLGRRARAALPALLCAAALLAQDPSRALAQVAPSAVVGSRVRITAPGLGLTAAGGTIREAEGGWILVQFDNPRRSVRIEREAITEMDVSIERRRNTLKGLGTGTLVGAGAGALLGLASGDDPPGTFLAFTAGEKAGILGVFFGATGAVIGLISGALIRTDVWQLASVTPPVPVDVSLRPFTTDRGTGVRVGVSLTTR